MAAELHRAVAGQVSDFLQQASVVKVSQIARAMHKDPRTVKHHLELMAATGSVIFLDAERTVLGTPATLSRAIEDVQWERTGLRELDDVWNNEHDEHWNNA